MKARKIVILAVLFTFHISHFTVFSQDTIQFTWNATAWEQMGFGICATEGKQFVIDWGNGYSSHDIPTTAGASWMNIVYYYDSTKEYTVTITSKTPDCFLTSLRTIYDYFPNYRTSFTALDVSRCRSLNYLEFIGSSSITDLDLSKNYTLYSFYSSLNRLTDLDLSKASELVELDCSANHLKTLLLNENIVLHYLRCGDNRFQLSDLYTFFKKVNPIFLNTTVLGTQRLDSLEIAVGEWVDFSSQAVFDGIATVFTITKSGLLADPNDYSIWNGIVEFRNKGNYTIIMTNAAMSQLDHDIVPHKVLVDISVTSDATLSAISVSKGVLSPVFSNIVYDYTVDVGYDTTEITIMATAADPNITISGDTGLRNLQIGSNVFTVSATNDTTTWNYTITVNRADNTGIAELQLQNYELRVTNEQLIINKEQLTINNIQIFNIVGQNLLSLQSPLSPEITIDISHLKSGIYIVKINNIKKKFIKK